MSHWGLFTNSYGKMLHPVLWVHGLLIALGLILACVIQPVLPLIVGSALRNGSSTVPSFSARTFVGGLLDSTLTSILTSRGWTLAYRRGRTDQLPAPLVNDFA